MLPEAEVSPPLFFSGFSSHPFLLTLFFSGPPLVGRTSRNYKQTVHQLQLQVYYRQLADWSRAPVSPFSVGAMLALSALPLQPVVKTSQRARLPPAAGKCKACKQGGMLLACSSV